MIRKVLDFLIENKKIVICSSVLFILLLISLCIFVFPASVNARALKGLNANNMTQKKLTRVLGKPDEKTETEMVWYENKFARLHKKVERESEKYDLKDVKSVLEKASFDDYEKELKKYKKLWRDYRTMLDMPHKRIIATIGYDSRGEKVVTSVVFDSQYKIPYSKSDLSELVYLDGLFSSKGSNAPLNNSFSLSKKAIKSVIISGDNCNEITGEIKYDDGSYQIKRISSSLINDSKTIYWSDAYGSYKSETSIIHNYENDYDCKDRVCLICGFVKNAVTKHNLVDDKCLCSICSSSVHELDDNCLCLRCGVTAHGIKNGVYCRHDNDLYFGEYPQTEIKDNVLISKLNELAGELPNLLFSKNWTSYKYHHYVVGYTISMWYIDVEYSGLKYRGVYFKQYRPATTEAFSAAKNSYQPENGYNASNAFQNTVYWFAYEPVKWNIISVDNNVATILSDVALDSQPYQEWVSINEYNSSKGVPKKTSAENYQYSTIRSWLNSSFYNAAFDVFQKNIIKTTEIENESSDGNNASLMDKIYLLSKKEYDSFNKSMWKRPSDYAKSQGCHCYIIDDENNNGNCMWRLRNDETVLAYQYKDKGKALILTYTYGSKWKYIDTGVGIVPVLRIQL